MSPGPRCQHLISGQHSQSARRQMSAHQRGGHATRWLLWFVCVCPATVAPRQTRYCVDGWVPAEPSAVSFPTVGGGVRGSMGGRVPKGLLLRTKLDRHPLSFFAVGHLFSKMNEVSICRRGDDDLKMTFRLPYTKRDR